MRIKIKWPVQWSMRRLIVILSTDIVHLYLLWKYFCASLVALWKMCNVTRVCVCVRTYSIIWSCRTVTLFDLILRSKSSSLFVIPINYETDFIIFATFFFIWIKPISSVTNFDESWIWIALLFRIISINEIPISHICIKYLYIMYEYWWASTSFLRNAQINLLLDLKDSSYT